MNEQEKLAIIADDFTGAGDSGIHFSRMGKHIELLLESQSSDGLHRHSNISLSSESRFMQPEQAAVTVATLFQRCRQAGFGKFFKKIDSTLRGNLGAEIESALECTGQAGALICPAMPMTGRTCISGNLYLNDVPLHLTEVGHDPFNPISTSSVQEVLSRQTRLKIGRIELADIEAGEKKLAQCLLTLIDQGCRLIVADAVTDSQLETLAGQLRAVDLLPVGSGGLAKALATVWKKEGMGNQQGYTIATMGPMLAVIGSLAEVSRRQAELACSQGYFHPFTIRAHDELEDIASNFSHLRSDLDGDTANILLRVEADNGQSAKVNSLEGIRIAHLLGAAAAHICRHYPCRAVFSTGGSTSMGVARELGIRTVALVDEIMPGVVLGSCTAPRTTVDWFISKAGSFGERELLNQIAATYTGGRNGDECEC